MSNSAETPSVSIEFPSPAPENDSPPPENSPPAPENDSPPPENSPPAPENDSPPTENSPPTPENDSPPPENSPPAPAPSFVEALTASDKLASPPSNTNNKNASPPPTKTSPPSSSPASTDSSKTPPPSPPQPSDSPPPKPPTPSNSKRPAASPPPPSSKEETPSLSSSSPPPAEPGQSSPPPAEKSTATSPPPDKVAATQSTTAKGMPSLEWPKRLRIAIGTAKGLAYLHEDCNPRIIHRDIKSANILLDEKFDALVADFGLARLNDTTHTHVSTRVMGTFGYLAPEYASSGKLTDRSDVYSFGVVLLELITGRKPVDPTQPLGDESLVEWARPILIRVIETGDLDDIVDPRLQKRYVESELFRMIETAAACVRHSAPKRPRMVQVVRALDNEEMSDLTNGVKYGQSTAYDSGQYSEEIIRFRRTAFSSEDSSEFNTNSGEYSSIQVSHGPTISNYTNAELQTRLSHER